MRIGAILRAGGGGRRVITQFEKSRTPGYNPYFPALEEFINLHTVKGKARMGFFYIGLAFFGGKAFVYHKYTKPKLLEEEALIQAEQQQFEDAYARWEANGRKFDYEAVVAM